MALSLLQWAKKMGRDCPKHQPVSSSLVQTTSYCSKCNRMWKLRRHTSDWKYVWWYTDDQGKFTERGGVGK